MQKAPDFKPKSQNSSKKIEDFGHKQPTLVILAITWNNLEKGFPRKVQLNWRFARSKMFALLSVCTFV